MVRRILVLLLLAGFLVLWTACGVSAAEPLEIGVGEAEITPPVGFPMAGYYHERLAEGAVDPLKAKAIAFRQGEVKAAVVVADLTSISRDLCLEVRRRASAATEIPPGNIAVSATHSHTAPDYSRHVYDYLGGKTRADGSQPYAARLIEGIVAALV